MILYSIMGIIISILILCLLILYRKYRSLEIRISESQSEYAALVRSIETTEEYIRELRIQKHDYQHQIRLFTSAVSSADDLKELKSRLIPYAEELLTDSDVLRSILSIDSLVLRSLLYGTYLSCRQSGIPFSLTLTPILPDFPMKEHEFAEVLANLLTNAVEANELLPKELRHLDVVIRADAGNNHIRISNPLDEESQFSAFETNPPSVWASQSRFPVFSNTTKGESHEGLGLFSCKRITDRCGVSLSVFVENNILSIDMDYEEP